jgi:hypothetical protein
VLGLLDEATALDFDVTCAIKLQQHEAVERQTFAAMIAAHLAALVTGNEPPLVEVVQTGMP